MIYRKYQKGVALLLSMVVLAVLSAWAVSICSISGTNVQLAENQRKADCARACAESGLEVIRFWLNRVAIPGNTAKEQVFSQIKSSFRSDLTNNRILNIITPHYDDSSANTIIIPGVVLDLAKGQNFSAVVRQVDAETLRVDVTGMYGSVAKTISANYKFGTRAHTVFDFGVATRGPLQLTGNVELEGVNVAVEASVYIESEFENEALSIIGNSQIAGDVSITNPDAYVILQGKKAGIGGQTGEEAKRNHVFTGVPTTEFPIPNPAQFECYATNIVNSSTNTSADATFENIRIAAGTNPTFSGNVTLRGIIFIETPNVVTFTGNSDITGIIVGDGNFEDNSGVNQINFLGNVESYSVAELPDKAQFTALKDETGTFVLAPGFSLSMGGSFNALNGAIAANGIKFFGNAGGIINGSVINYSGGAMTLTGNSNLYFNHSGTTKVPAGFMPEIVLQYDPASYSESAL
jgi:Tfp pilus assembly protein PilX